LDGVLQTNSETMPAKGIVLPRADNGTVITIALAVLAVMLAAVSFAIGPAQIGISDLFSGLFGQHGTATVIAREIRLPRALLALVVGGALGASGAALQGLFRNPLADPGVTGVTSSAGFGAVIAMYFGFAAINPLILPASAIAGAVATSTILYFLSRAGAERTALILAGAAIASLATAMTALAMSLAPNPYAMSEMIRWMMGSLKDSTLADFELALVPVVGGVAILWSADARRRSGAIAGRECAWRSAARGDRRGVGNRCRHSSGGRGEFRWVGGAASAAAVLRLRTGAADHSFGTRRRGACHRG
jgi:iron complex transport system permease protein